MATAQVPQAANPGTHLPMARWDTLANADTENYRPKSLPVQPNRNFRHPVESQTCRRQVTQMIKRKAWKCSACGAEIPDLPMPVLRHQLGHVEWRPFAGDRAEPDAPPAEDPHQRQ